MKGGQGGGQGQRKERLSQEPEKAPKKPKRKNQPTYLPVWSTHSDDTLLPLASAEKRMPFGTTLKIHFKICLSTVAKSPGQFYFHILNSYP